MAPKKNATPKVDYRTETCALLTGVQRQWKKVIRTSLSEAEAKAIYELEARRIDLNREVDKHKNEHMTLDGEGKTEFNWDHLNYSRKYQQMLYDRVLNRIDRKEFKDAMMEKYREKEK